MKYIRTKTIETAARGLGIFYLGGFYHIYFGKAFLSFTFKRGK